MDHRSGFESLSEDDETESAELSVEGTLPDWLTGALVRNGPAAYENDGATVNHWFDGMAMLHRFGINGADDEVVYTSRFLRTKAYDGFRDGEIRLSEFATDPCEGIFGRFFSYFTAPEPTDNASVNVVHHDGDFLALTETTLPVEFDAETLETLGVRDEEGHVTTAHPYIDPETGEKVSYVARFGRTSEYRVYVDDGERKTRARIPVKKPAYMHSFGATRSYVVLVEFPHRLNPLDILLGNDTVAESYGWKPDEGTRFVVIDRGTGEVVAEPRTESFFAFHHINAYEDGDEVVLDIAAYDDASVIDELYLDRARSAPPLNLSATEFRRYRLDLSTGNVDHETLYDRHFELPHVRNDAWGRAYRYAYGVGNTNTPPETLPNRLVKFDTHEAEATTWTPDGFPSEPVFVPSPDNEDRDGGVVLTVVLYPDEAMSSLVVLDAATFDEIARADVGRRVPFGFHGGFFGDELNT